MLSLPEGIVIASLLVAIWCLLVRIRAGTGKLRTESKRREAAEARAVWAADHDVYTEMPRLRTFLERVDQCLSAAATEAESHQVVALRPADLNRKIHTLGHESGLAASMALAARLKALDLPVIGQSRDVFLVFGDKERIAAHFRKYVSLTSTASDGIEVLPPIHAGAAAWPADGRTASELLRRAETAMAVAIARHESWVNYRPSFEPDEGDLRLVELFRSTRGAGLYPVFQPQIDIRSGATVGAEVLVRWTLPEFGPVSPARFIPLLEDAGLVQHVTTRMIGEAVRMSAALRRKGSACPISVNVAVSDLVGENVTKLIHKALQANDGFAGDLKLELTETSAAERLETVRWVMQRLRDSGVRLSIDDYGTGYSSLSYLNELPIHEVKIDRSFIAGIEKKASAQSVVRSTIEMAHELGLIVVAEGIDSEAALEFLRNHDCDRAQGFLISKPLSADDFVAFVQTASERAARFAAG
jgi:EAL domain-containing protein (putative c-di-GMP-specific phosphodiesterase class I)